MSKKSTVDLTFRATPRESDIEVIRTIISSSGFFNSSEIALAQELIREWLRKGAESGYQFLFMESVTAVPVSGNSSKKVLGYSCYGLIPLTLNSFDLYWIALDDEWRGRGLGRGLLSATHNAIASQGGRRIYSETSGRRDYRPTQQFYLSCGYRERVRLANFYAQGDDKIIYEYLLPESKELHR